MTGWRRLTAIVLVVAACSTGSSDQVTGVVTAVEGSISAVESFTLRLPDGTDRTFETALDVVLHNAASTAHLRDHLVSGVPVEIRFRELDDGRYVATEIGD